MRHSEWYDGIVRRIESAAAPLTGHNVKRMRVEVLTRIAARVDAYSLKGCSDCEGFKVQVEQLVALLEEFTNNDKVDGKLYRSQMREIIKHLRDGHGLVEEGAYMSQWSGIGLCFGVVFMNIFGPAYIGVGLCIGIAIGSSMDAKAKKEGKVI